MNNKELQSQRMKRYFIDAAKEILAEDGVKKLSVRKVGDRAGYSYATIYNYFRDLNELLTYCLADMLEDAYRALIAERQEGLDPRAQLIRYGERYFSYFSENPVLFQLLFIEDLGAAPEEVADKMGDLPSVGQLLIESIAACAKAGYILEDQVEVLAELLASSIHGKLLFFLKRRSLEPVETMLEKIRSEIGYLVRRK
jgi:AcrR family transcriptional regulator